MLEQSTLDRFTKNTLTTSFTNRTLEITNDGPTSKVVDKLSFVTNTPIKPHLVNKNDTFTTVKLPNGYYSHTLIPYIKRDVVPNQTVKILDYEIKPNKTGKLSEQITLNPLNVTATLSDGTVLFLPQTGQTHPKYQPFPISGSFTENEAYDEGDFGEKISDDVTALELDSITFELKNGTVTTKVSDKTNKVWSIAQTITEKTGRNICWGLVGDCSNNNTQINWPDFIPKYAEMIAKNISEAYAVFGQKTPFSCISINTLGCNINAFDLLNFMMMLNNNLEESTALHLTVPMGIGKEALPQKVLTQLSHMRVNLTVDTASHRPPNDNLTTTVDHLKKSGTANKSIKVSMPAGTYEKQVIENCKIIKARNLYGANINHFFNNTETAKIANGELNNNTYELQPATSAGSVVDARGANAALGFMIGYGFWKLAKLTYDTVSQSRLFNNFRVSK